MNDSVTGLTETSANLSDSALLDVFRLGKSPTPCLAIYGEVDRGFRGILSRRWKRMLKSGAMADSNPEHLSRTTDRLICSV